MYYTQKLKELLSEHVFLKNIKYSYDLIDNFCKHTEKNRGYKKVRYNRLMMGVSKDSV